MGNDSAQIERRGKYLKIPTKRAGGTRGREYWNETRIQRIREMAISGNFDSPEEALAKFAPLHDDKPEAPYTQEERLIVVPQSAPFNGSVDLTTLLAPSLELAQPTIMGEYSCGATTPEEHIAAARTADALRLLFGIGEGGWYPGIRHHTRIMVQVASGVFGITGEILQNAAAISVKMAQSAKPGAGGHVKGHKITVEMAATRGMPMGIDYISDANRIFSIEEVRQIVHSVRKASGGKPVFIKCAATHDLAAIVAGAIEAGADGVIIDGRGGGTGAAPMILRNRTCMPIELAVAQAHRIRHEKGAENFRIIAAGRVDLPRKAFKLHLLGADAVMLATAALVSTGCIMVHQCHVKCPPLVATAHAGKNGRPEMRLDPEWATHVLTSFMKTFGEAEARYAAWAGFSRIRDAIGRKDLLRGIALDPELGVEALTGYADVEAEMQALWKQDIADPFYPWQRKHEAYLAASGTIEIGSMGRTTDLDPPRSFLDGLMIEGRHVVGPSYDVYRDMVETTTMLPGKVRLDIPLLIAPSGKESAIEMLQAAASRRTAVFLSDETAEQLIRDAATKKEVLSRAENILLDVSRIDGSRFGEQMTDEDLGFVRNVAGIVVPQALATNMFVRHIRTYTDRPVYARIAATGNIERDVVHAARNGVKGIIIEGSLGIRQFELGSDTPLPLEIAVPLADEALLTHAQQGKILRPQVALLAQGNIRGPDDLYMLCALGANSVIGTGLGAKNGDQLKEIEMLLNGYKLEMQVNMGAGGASMMSSVVGNRDLLRADEMPRTIREWMGVEFMGE